MTFWKSETFKELQKAWYERLQDIGFTDAEVRVGDDMLLKQYNLNKVPISERRKKESYYIVLSHHLHNTVFNSEIDLIIMTWYAEGKKQTSISIELDKIGKYRCRRTIYSTIRRYEIAWGMRE